MEDGKDTSDTSLATRGIRLRDCVLTIYELSIFEVSSDSFGGTIATIAIIFEFSLGALLGWKVKNIWWGIALWIAANILARAAVFLFALYVVENYF